MHIVLDTNVLLVSASRNSSYFPIFQSFLQGKYELCVSNEILYEYHEVITRHMGDGFAINIYQAIINSPHVVFIQPFFRWNLIAKDPDDNKFVDCAISANAQFVVTNDRHFDVLKTVKFPQVDVITASGFLRIIV